LKGPKAFQVPVHWRFIILLVFLLFLLLMGTNSAFAVSLGDYFSYTYEVTLNKTEVRGNEAFFAMVEGRAACKKDLPVRVSEAQITLRVVARHPESGVVMTLDPGYTVAIDPFPSRKGEITAVSAAVPLQFAESSLPGTYNLIAELIEARVKATVWLPITGYLPSPKSVGSITYVVSQVAPIPASDTSFITRDLSLSPAQAYVGEEVVISALVDNRGDHAASRKVALKLNGVKVGSRDITLEAGASVDVAFTISLHAPGSYSIRVGNLSDTLIVTQLLSNGESSRWLLAGIAIAGCAIVGLIVWLVARRRGLSRYDGG
jgi:hypothetical protein